ncbi:MAG: hypothetical protein GY835_06935 [bacterium]|nr:hypothetical protein [bacterium]
MMFRSKAFFSTLVMTVMVGLLAGCGGGGNVAVAVKTDLPPLDFSFRPTGENMKYSVSNSQEVELHGGSFVSSLRFQWRATGWKQDEKGDWSTDVKFTKVQGARRNDMAITMEPIKEFKQLEGFKIGFLRSAESCEPINMPSKSDEFNGMFEQLKASVDQTLYMSPADEVVHPGGSWQQIATEEDLGPMASVLTDSIITFTYVRDEVAKFRDCARIEIKGKLMLDGIIEGPQGSGRIKGSIDIKGHGNMDKATGIFVTFESSVKSILSQQEVDDKGEPFGPEQSFTSTETSTVIYLGK